MYDMMSLKCKCQLIYMNVNKKSFLFLLPFILPPFNAPCLLFPCKVQTGKFVVQEETWPLKMFCS